MSTIIGMKVVESILKEVADVSHQIPEKAASAHTIKRKVQGAGEAIKSAPEKAVGAVEDAGRKISDVAYSAHEAGKKSGKYINKIGQAITSHPKTAMGAAATGIGLTGLAAAKALKNRRDKKAGEKG